MTGVCDHEHQFFKQQVATTLKHTYNKTSNSTPIIHEFIAENAKRTSLLYLWKKNSTNVKKIALFHLTLLQQSQVLDSLANVNNILSYSKRLVRNKKKQHLTTTKIQFRSSNWFITLKIYSSQHHNQSCCFCTF